MNLALRVRLPISQKKNLFRLGALFKKREGNLRKKIGSACLFFGKNPGKGKIPFLGKK